MGFDEMSLAEKLDWQWGSCAKVWEGVVALHCSRRHHRGGKAEGRRSERLSWSGEEDRGREDDS